MTIADLISAVFLPAGATLSLVGAIGILRFPDLLTRLHAAAKPQTLGLALVLIGTAPQLGWAESGPLVPVILFQLITAPIVAGTISRAAHRTGQYEPARLIVDELATGTGDRESST